MQDQTIDARWQLRLFGNLECHRPDGATVSFAGKRKAGEVLARLALQPGHKLRREDLAERCWPESDTQRQRVRLRQEISVLRGLLADPSETLLEVTNDYLLLLTDRVDIDVAQFERAIEAAEASNDIAIKMAVLRSAVALYRDDLLIEHPDSFTGERTRFRLAYDRAIHEQARAAMALGDYSVAEDLLVQLVRRDPLLEEAHADLMRIFAATDRPSALRRQFRELKQVLQEQLNSEPTPLTRLLLDQLLSSPASKDINTASTQIIESRIDLGETQSDMAGVVTAFPNQSVAIQPLLRRMAMPVVLASSLCIAGVFIVIASLNRKPTLSNRIVVEREPAAWIYQDRPEAGEKPNSEALAATTDRFNNLFVAGIVDTDREDTDGLIFRFLDGRLVWRKRITGPGHDCDRPLSIVSDNESGVYVTGETYAPMRPELTAEWRLFAAHFDPAGRCVWYRQSEFVIKKDLHTQAISDHMGGLVVAATERSNNAECVRFVHYGPLGNPLHTWRYPAQGSVPTSFVKMTDSQDGRIYACATQRRQEGSSASPASKWAILCFDSTGRMQWDRFYEGSEKGQNDPVGICIDRKLNVFVAGTCAVGSQTDGTASMCPLIIKYTGDGTPVWQRMYTPLRGDCYVNSVTCTDDGLVVTLAGDTMTSKRKIAAFALSYSELGTLLHSFTDPLTSGYGSSNARFVITDDTGDPTLVTALSSKATSQFNDKCEIGLLSFRHGDTGWNVKTFTQTNNTVGWTLPRFAINIKRDLYSGGRLPTKAGASALFIVRTALSSR